MQSEVESLLRSGGVPLESLDRSDGGNPSALMQKREIGRLTKELLKSDSGINQSSYSYIFQEIVAEISLLSSFLFANSTGRGPTSL